jgi:hypothetical protein
VRMEGGWDWIASSVGVLKLRVLLSGLVFSRHGTSECWGCAVYGTSSGLRSIWTSVLAAFQIWVKFSQSVLFTVTERQLRLSGEQVRFRIVSMLGAGCYDVSVLGLCARCIVSTSVLFSGSSFAHCCNRPYHLSFPSCPSITCRPQLAIPATKCYYLQEPSDRPTDTLLSAHPGTASSGESCRGETAFLSPTDSASASLSCFSSVSLRIHIIRCCV